MVKITPKASMAIATTARPPLGDTTNSPPPSPPPDTKKSATQVLRRKATLQKLNANLDSSESYPSHHSSLYEASLLPNEIPDPGATLTSDKDLCTTNEDVPPSGSISWENTFIDSNGNRVPSTFLRPIDPRRIHTPHELYPITEKSSFATLRPSSSLRSKVSTKISTTTLRSRSPGLNGSKRKSFSLSDLPPPPSPNPDRNSSPSPPPAKVPLPNRPVRLPPTRSPTPPSLPSFGKPEAMTYRLPPPHPASSHSRKPSQSLKQRFNALVSPNMAPEWQEYRAQTIGLPRGVVMRGDNGVLVRGKFVPIRSGHLPPQRQRHVVFSGPNTNGTALSGPTQYQDAIAGSGIVMTGAGAGGGADAGASAHVGERRKERRGLWGWCCWVCEEFLVDETDEERRIAGREVDRTRGVEAVRLARGGMRR